MGRPRGSLNAPFLVRFWSKVDVRSENECWPWIAGQGGRGYGIFKLGGGGKRPVAAHRVAYELQTGEEAVEGMEVDHLCHNVLCQNARHMRLVTPSEHATRHQARKRKLTNGQAADIRRRLAEGASAWTLAREYKVDRTVIRQIKTGKTYREGGQ